MPTTDCLIIGAGPAGSLLARQLARDGLVTTLLHRPAPRVRGLGETILPTAHPLLVRLGVEKTLRQDGFLAPLEHGIAWGEDALAVREGDPASPGYLVDRERFDEGLRSEAKAAGATVIEVRDLHGCAEDALASGLVAEVAAGATIRLRARAVAVAAGRNLAASLVRSLVRVELPETVAIFAHSETREPERQTHIVAVPEGWWWSVPTQGGGRGLALFADPEEVRARGRGELWSNARRAALLHLPFIPVVPEASVLASARSRESVSPVWLVGDSASALDPLSTQGVEKALASAERAASIVQECLSSPQKEPDLRAYQREWEHRLFMLHAQRTQELYRSETRFPDRPFWRKRRQPLVRYHA